MYKLVILLAFNPVSLTFWWIDMNQWLKNLFKAAPAQSDSSAALLEAEARIRRLELDVQNMEQVIAVLQSDLAQREASQQSLSGLEVSTRLDDVFRSAAAPITQLLTLFWLHEDQQKNLQAGDVLAVAQRLINSLERSGMQIVHQVGEIVAFDPDRHSPLSASEESRIGGPVKVRFVGVAHQGRILLKAAVEPAHRISA